MPKKIPENLYILEIANNHMGDIKHGINLINSFGKICNKYEYNFALKLIRYCLGINYKIKTQKRL